jgi:ferric-dicitrate binding protein FerR (iron transport regulator)
MDESAKTAARDRETEGVDSADALALLIRKGGRRATPPAAAYDLALAAATRTWQEKLRRRNQRRWISAAASILLAATMLWLVRPWTHTVPPIAGRTDRIIGTVEVKRADGEWVALRNDAFVLNANDQIRTRSGSLAGILLADGTSVRLADTTNVVLESDARLRLVSGKVYLDSGTSSGAPDVQHLEVVTAAGTAVDIGTQFEVLYRDAAYRLRVREGRVRLHREPGSVESIAGEQWTIDASGVMKRGAVQRADPEWHWTQSVAPALEVDGQPMTVLLAWVARETGRAIRYETPRVERLAQATVLYGNIHPLTPLDALSVMLVTTDMEFALVENDAILIRLKTR